jgi:sporulation integral membrane protein YtvI
MNLNKQRAFIIHFIFFLILTLLLYVGIKYVFPLLMPFVIGIVIAMSFRNLIDLIEKRTHIKRVFISIITLLAFYSLLGFIISLIGVKMVNFVSSLFYNLPTLYKETLLPALNSVTDNMIDKYPSTRTYLDNFMSNIDQSVFTYLSQISTKVVSMATGFAGMLPTLLIKFIFTIVSSFFFTIDYYKITRFIIRQFKPEHQKVILNLKDNVIGSLGNFIKAYTAIISITFAELSIGFWILGIPSPFLFGLLVAIIDIMPILGTGAVLLPWSVIAFIIGNTKVGMGMLILYIVITVVRQILEPKIVGQQIGLYPIVTLVLMYVGAQLMGVLGLLVLPIMATILIKLNKEGSIHLFKI